jgi:hypothetical protein
MIFIPDSPFLSANSRNKQMIKRKSASSLCVPHGMKHFEFKIKGAPRFHPNCAACPALKPGKSEPRRSSAVTGVPGRGSPLHSAVVERHSTPGRLQRTRVCRARQPSLERAEMPLFCPHHRFKQDKVFIYSSL